jgi:uncharacterized protein DUF4412
MRLLSMLLVAGTLIAAPIGCSKAPDSSAASKNGVGDSGALTSTAASGVMAATPPSPGGRPTFPSDFEGGLVMRTTTAQGTKDLLFVTKGGKLRVDTPEPEGRTAHTIFDPAASKLTIIMDSQELAMQMPIPHAADATVTKPPTITRTGKHETIAGYDCEDWEIVSAGGNHESTCVAQGLPFFDFSALAGPAGGHSWAEELRDKNAFPLRAVDLDPSGKEISRMEVTRIDKRPVDDTAFTVPPRFHVMDVPNAANLAARPLKTK